MPSETDSRPRPPWLDLPVVVDSGHDDGAAFRALGCRGFSYEYTDAPDFRLPFARRVDLRAALLLEATLAHPPAVEQALRRHHCQHVTSARGRAAAFALGSTRRGPAGLEWFVYVLQSDLAVRGPAVLRDYLRGWRKVLFANLLRAAAGAGAAAVHLAPAAEVFASARRHPGYPMRTMPAVWEAIYDRTAADFGMRRVAVSPPVNVQSVPRRRAYACDTFFRLTLPELATDEHG